MIEAVGHMLTAYKQWNFRITKCDYSALLCSTMFPEMYLKSLKGKHDQPQDSHKH